MLEHPVCIKQLFYVILDFSKPYGGGCDSKEKTDVIYKRSFVPGRKISTGKREGAADENTWLLFKN